MPGGTPMQYPFPYKTEDGQGLSLGSGTLPGTVIIAGSTSTQIGTAPPGTASITNIYSTTLNSNATDTNINSTNNTTVTSSNTTINDSTNTNITSGATTTITSNDTNINSTNNTTVTSSNTTINDSTNTNITSGATTTITSNDTNITSTNNTNVTSTNTTTIGGGTVTNITGQTTTVSGTTSTVVGSGSSPTTINGTSITFTGPLTTPYFVATDSNLQYRTSGGFNMDFVTTSTFFIPAIFNFNNATGSTLNSQINANKFISNGPSATTLIMETGVGGNTGDITMTSSAVAPIFSINNIGPFGIFSLSNNGTTFIQSDAGNNTTMNITNSLNIIGPTAAPTINFNTSTGGSTTATLTSNCTTLYLDALNISLNASQLIGGTILLTGANLDIISNVLGHIKISSQISGNIDLTTVIGEISMTMAIGAFLVDTGLGAISLTTAFGDTTLNTIAGAMTLTTEAGAWVAGSLAGIVTLSSGAGLLTITSLAGAMTLNSVDLLTITAGADLSLTTVGLLDITAGGLLTLSVAGGLSIIGAGTALLGFGALTVTSATASVTITGTASYSSTLATSIDSAVAVYLKNLTNHILDIGPTGATLFGTLSMQGGALGQVTIVAPTPITSYNFNLPTTAGTSGQYLVSGGGGAADMGWTSSIASVSTALATATGPAGSIVANGGIYIAKNLMVEGTQNITNANTNTELNSALFIPNGSVGLNYPVCWQTTSGSGVPLTGTTRSTGTRLILYPNQLSSQCDYATGISSGILWNSVPTGAEHGFYINASIVFAISATSVSSAPPFIGASIQTAAPPIISPPTAATGAIQADGGIYILDNMVIDGTENIGNSNIPSSTNCSLLLTSGSLGMTDPFVFSTAAGSSLPANGPSRSSGTRIILYPNQITVPSNQCDYSLGISSNTLWYSAPVGAVHDFFVDATSIVTISETVLHVIPTTVSTSTTTGCATFAGGVGIAGTLTPAFVNITGSGNSLAVTSTTTASSGISASVILGGGIYITDNIIIVGSETIGVSGGSVSNLVSATTSSVFINGGTLGLNGRLCFSASLSTGVPVSGASVRSPGTRVILYPSQTAGFCDYALGIATNTLWYNSPLGALHNFLVDSSSILTISGTVLAIIPTTASTSTTTGCATFAGGIGVAGATYTAFLDVTGSGNTVAVTSTTLSISGTTGSATFAGGIGMAGNLVNTSSQSVGNGNVVDATTTAVYLTQGIGINGRLSWPMTGGFAAPLAGTTRSAGTRLILYPNQVTSNCDYAIGLASANLWFSVPTTATFHFYITAVDTVSISASFLSTIVPISLSQGAFINFVGSTSGTISMKQQAIAGTYNFNLPTTAGTSGQFLTSGGGGSTAMTWTSSSVSGAISVTSIQTTGGTNVNNAAPYASLTGDAFIAGGGAVVEDWYVGGDPYWQKFGGIPAYYNGTWTPQCSWYNGVTSAFVNLTTSVTYAKWFQVGNLVIFSYQISVTLTAGGSAAVFLRIPTVTIAGNSFNPSATSVITCTLDSNYVLYPGGLEPFTCFTRTFGGTPLTEGVYFWSVTSGGSLQNAGSGTANLAGTIQVSYNI